MQLRVRGRLPALFVLAIAAWGTGALPATALAADAAVMVMQDGSDVAHFSAAFAETNELTIALDPGGTTVGFQDDGAVIEAGRSCAALGRGAVECLAFEPPFAEVYVSLRDGDDRAAIAGDRAASTRLVIWAGPGNDELIGAPSSDTMTGDEGDDTLSGGAGHDALSGNAGRDTLDGGEGNDMLFGDDGEDTLVGGGGDDWIDARDRDHSADRISCGPGRDSVYTNGSDDIAADCETVRVLPMPARNLSRPRISGVARVGQALTVHRGEWWSEAPVTYWYRWIRCDAEFRACAYIEGEHGEHYEVGEEDLGSRLRVEVSGTTEGGGQSEISELTDVVAAAAEAEPEPDTPPPARAPADEPAPPPPAAAGSGAGTPPAPAPPAAPPHPAAAPPIELSQARPMIPAARYCRGLSRRRAGGRPSAFGACVRAMRLLASGERRSPRSCRPLRRSSRTRRGRSPYRICVARGRLLLADVARAG